MAKDPVCSMTVDEKTPVAKMEYEGKVYYFCCTNCLEQFKKNPQQYIEVNRVG